MKKSLSFSVVFLLIVIISGCKSGSPEPAQKVIRYFSDESFWNQPIPENPEIDTRNTEWIEMLKKEPTQNNFGTSYSVYTVPVYEADSSTPLYDIKYQELSDDMKKNWDSKVERFGHGPGFDRIPIPDSAIPDPQGDHHMAIVDWSTMTAWDMWGCEKLPDGSWKSNTGMKYSLTGSGVFDSTMFPIKNGESIHFYGPSRAAGVPIIAGLIRYDEVMAGEINHKLSFASRYCAYQEHCFPAVWTDGPVDGGIPEGAVIQLDPKLDLSQYDLTPEELVVAKALQKYGMVLVDWAGGQPIYAEGLYGHSGKTWKGKLREWEKAGINSIPYDKYRVLKVQNAVFKGDGKSKKKK